MKPILTLAIVLLSVSGWAQVKLTKADSDTIAHFGPEHMPATKPQFHQDTSIHWVAYSPPKYYKVNWSKVRTLKDLKAILQAMQIQFCLDEKQINPIKKYLIITK